MPVNDRGLRTVTNTPAVAIPDRRAQAIPGFLVVIATVLALIATSHAPYAVALAVAIGAVGLWAVQARVSAHVLLLLVPVSFVIPTPYLATVSNRTMPVQWAEALLGLALALWLRRRPHVDRHWLLAVLAGLVWMALTLVAAADRLRALTGVKIGVEVALLALLAAAPMVGRYAPATRIQAVIWMSRSALAASAAYAALLIRQGALANFSLGFTPVDAGAVAASHNSLTLVTLAVGRANYLGALMLLGIVAALASWPWIGRTERILTFWGIALASVGIVATGSKAQLIAYGLCLVLAVLLLASVRRSVAERPIGVSLGAYAVFIAFSWQYLGAVLSTLRVEGPTPAGGTSANAQAGPLPDLSQYVSDEGTTGRRLEIWSSALQAIREHPILGSGPANVNLGSATHPYPTAHNVVLQIAVESGVPGLLLYAWPFVILLRRAQGVIRRGIVLVVAGLLLGGAGEPTLRTGPYDLVAWAIVGVWAGLILDARATATLAGGDHARTSPA